MKVSVKFLMFIHKFIIFDSRTIYEKAYRFSSVVDILYYNVDPQYGHIIKATWLHSVSKISLNIINSLLTWNTKFFTGKNVKVLPYSLNQLSLLKRFFRGCRWEPCSDVRLAVADGIDF